MRKKTQSRLKFFVAAAAVVLAGVTCTDSSPTGPHTGRGGLSRFGFAPAFSRAAAEIFQNLEAFGFEVDNVHVHLNHADGQTAKDTVVVVVPGQDSVVIELTVSLDASQEQLNANIELRDGSTVLFSGTEEIAAKTGAIATAPPAIPVEYTGPGAAATTLLLAPHDTAVIAGDSLVLHPSGKDKNGANVPDLALAWSVKDAARGTVNDKGVFKSSVGRGATYVVGRLLSGPRDSAHINVTPPATKVVLVSGGGQTGIVGKALSQPIVVETQAADNLPVPFVALGFHVTSGGGSVSSASAFTDANGRATVALTLGTTAGANSVGVDLLASQALVVSATGNPDKATKLAVSQQPSANALSGTALATQPKVQVLDSFGNAVAAANIGITAKLTTAGGRVLGGTLTVNTNASGVATFTDLKISGPPGTASLTFGQDTLASAVSTDVAVVVGPAAAMALDGASELSVAAGAAIANPPAVVVTDAGGNGVAGAPVHLVVTGNGGTASDATVNTDADGRVSLAVIPALNTTGVYTITASNATLSGSPLTLHLAVMPGPAHHLEFVQQPSNGTGGALLAPITVAVLDQFGNRVVAGAGSTTNITLSLGGPAGATLGPDAAARTKAAVSGLATFNVSVDKANTGYSLIAAAAAPIANASSSTFNIAVGAPAQLVALSGEGQGALKGGSLASPIVVRVMDAGGNDVNGAPTTFSIVSGEGTLNGSTAPLTVNTNTTGQALAQVNWQPGTVGAQLARAQVSALTLDFHAFLAETLVVIRQPSINLQSGVLIPQQPVVQLQDLQHNPVRLANFPVRVTAQHASLEDVSTPTVAGTDILLTDANGVAAWTDLTLTGHVQLIRLAFADTSGISNVLPTQSMTLAFLAGPATQLQFDASPSDAPQNTLFAAIVTARDAQGNVATTFAGSVTVAIGTNPGSGTLAGTTTVTATSGIAHFDNLSINNAGTGYTLVASASGLTSATSFTFGVLPPVSFASVSAGVNHTCALTTTGSAYCWGSNSEGSLGNNSTNGSLTPVAVLGPAFANITSGQDFTCGVGTDNVGYCWGANSNGVLGIAGAGVDLTPMPVDGGLSFTSISAGYVPYNCGVTTSHAAYCWGYNGYGNIGDGSAFAQANSPSLVAGSLSFASVVAGSTHACGLTTSGAAYCWGSNYEGELGTGSATPTYSQSPVQVTVGVSYTAMTAGNEHTCVLNTLGYIYCWGQNDYGQLGNGSTSPSMTPILTPQLVAAPGVTFVQMSANALHTCAVASDHKAYCWGQNFNGELGDGSIVSKSTPTLVAGGLTFTSISAGNGYTCGVTTDGAVYCWGSNAFGRLGDGTLNDRPLPVRVSP